MTATRRQKLIAAFAAGVFVVGLAPALAFAEGALVLDSDSAGPKYDLTVSGLEDGDTVTYYQIIEQDVDTTDENGAVQPGTQQWKLTSAVDADGDGIVDGTKAADGTGLTVDDMVITSFETSEDGKTVSSDTRQLTADMANAIATAVTNNHASPIGEALTAEDGAVAVAGADAGMYMFTAVPKDGQAGYLYKPVFVSADYYNTASTPEDGTHLIGLEPGETDYAGDNGVFKRSPLTIVKQSGIYDDDGNPVDLQQDVAVGDTVNFSITVPVPTYTQNYVAPQFYITDTLTEGLKLDADSIQVTVANEDESIDVSEGKDYRVFVKDKATDGVDYFDFKGTVDEESTFDAFVVQFLSDDPDTTGKMDGFLYTVVGAPTCTITYTATVEITDSQKFEQQITQVDNITKLEYSCDPNYIPDGYFKPNSDDPDNPDAPGDPDPDYPSDTPDPEDPTGELEDRTRHYTFDIDADVLGRAQSGDTVIGPDGQPTDEPLAEEDHNRTSELRKIWVDANGKAIQEKQSGVVNKGGTEEDGVETKTETSDPYGFIEGAEFMLTKVQRHVTKGIGEEAFEACDPEQILFDPKTHIRDAKGSNPVSDGKGYIAMKGLDAGVYKLKEVKAPLGYSFNPNVEYTITITPDFQVRKDEGKDVLILKSYKVEIETNKLDDNLNPVGSEKVKTVAVYNLKQDEGGPISLLKEDGTSNVGEPEDADQAQTMAGIVVDETFGNNETATVTNKKVGILPATGGSGILFYLFGGGAIALVSYLLLRRLKRASNVQK